MNSDRIDGVLDIFFMLVLPFIAGFILGLCDGLSKVSPQKIEIRIIDPVELRMRDENKIAIDPESFSWIEGGKELRPI